MPPAAPDKYLLNRASKKKITMLIQPSAWINICDATEWKTINKPPLPQPPDILVNRVNTAEARGNRVRRAAAAKLWSMLFAEAEHASQSHIPLKRRPRQY